MILEFEKIEELEIRRRIARMASLACFELMPDFNEPDIQYTNENKFGRYIFCKIKDNKGKVLYGFYNEQCTDFLPLNEAIDAFSYLEFFEKLTINEEIKAEFGKLLTDNTNKEEIITNCKRNYDNYLPVRDWSYYGISTDIYKNISGLFEDKIEQLWSAKLNFTNFLLAEYIFNVGNERIRNYALYKMDCDFEISEFYILDGISTNIYNAWDSENNFNLRTKDNYINYVKFFCWALVDNEKNRFLLPENINEVPWMNVPRKNEWEKLCEITDKFKDSNLSFEDYSNKTNSINTNEEVLKYLKGIVVIWGYFIKATFSVNRNNGYIEMIEDEPIEIELPIGKCNIEDSKTIKESKGNSFLNLKNKPSKDTRYKDDEIANYPAYINDLKNSNIITTEQFIKTLLENGKIENKKIIEKLTICNNSTNSIKIKCSEIIVISNCWFDDNVIFCGESFGSSVIFRKCMFAKTFSARESIFKNSLLFENCFFNDIKNKKEGKQGVVVDFHCYQSEGDLKFVDCEILGEFLGTEMALKGDFKIESCRIANCYSNIFKEIAIYNNIARIVISYVSEKNNNYISIDNNKFIYFGNKIDDTPILKLDNSIFSGDLNITWDTNNVYSCILGNFSSDGINVLGKTSLYGTLIIGNLFIRNCSFSQDFRLSGDWIWKFVEFRIAIGYMDATGSVFNSSLLLTRANIDYGIIMQSIKVDSHVELLGLEIKDGNIDFNFSMIKGLLHAYLEPENFTKTKDIFTNITYNNEILLIYGNFTVSGSEINHIRLEGIKIIGLFEALTCCFKTFRINCGLNIPDTDFNSNDFSFKIRKSEVNRIHLQSINIIGNLEIAGVEVKGDNLINKDLDLCNIKSCHIGGDILFWNTGFFIDFIKSRYDAINNLKRDKDLSYKYEDSLGDKFLNFITDNINEFKSIIRGNLNLESNIIGGCIDIRNTEVDFDTKINDCNLRSNIKAHSFLKYYSTDNKSERILGLKTVCNNLEMKRTEIGGDVLFDGISVKNVIDAENSNIGGKISFYEEKENTIENKGNLGNKYYLGKIGDCLNLSSVKADSLKLAKENFTNETGKINLNGITLNKFEVRTPINKEIDLRNSSIKNINFNHSDDKNYTKSNKYNLLFSFLPSIAFIFITLVCNSIPIINLNNTDWSLTITYLLLLAASFVLYNIIKNKNTNSSIAYKTLLNNVTPFDKAVYTDIESKLRDISEDASADEIYRLMNKKIFNDTLKKNKENNHNNTIDYFTYHLKDKVYGHGTRLFRLALIWYSVFLFYSIILNIEGNTVSKTDKSMKPTIINSIEVALVNNLPILDIASSDDLKYKIKDGYEIIAYFMKIISYALLTFAGLGLTSKVIRGNKN